MGSHIGEQITAILVAIIGVAILAVILSPKSQTSQVISSAAGGFSQMLGIAVSPVTGQGFSGGGSNTFAGGGFTSGMRSATNGSFLFGMG